jgi:hypothetical protein
MSGTYPTPIFSGVTLQTPLAPTQGGTGASTLPAARTALGAAAAGANSDITSLAGLTTPLAPSQGGTGGSTPAAALSAIGAAAVGGSNTQVFNVGTPEAGAHATPASSVVMQIASVTALRAATAVMLPGTHCHLAGFATAGDGGQGVLTCIASDTTSADNGVTIFVDASYRRWYRDWDISRPIPVKWAGALCNGTHDDTAAFNSALAALGGAAGTVTFSGNASISSLTLPSRATLRGNIPGPYSFIYSINVSQYPVLMVSQSSTTFITMGLSDSQLRDFAIYYPGQVAPTASTPTVYPFAVTSPGGSGGDGGGNAIQGLTIINAYQGITGSFARGFIKHCLIGAYKSGLSIDFTEDFFDLDHVYHQVMWDIYAGLSYPQTIDTWVKNNGGALTIFRADGYHVSNWGVFGHGTGITLADSSTSQSPNNGYGKFVNIEIDTVAYGINAVSTNNSGGGVAFTNLNCYATIADIVLNTGGASAPQITWIGGTSRGVGHYDVLAGTLNCIGVNGINGPYGTVPNLTSPSVPASNTYLTNPFPFAVTVYLSGGTIANIDINGKAIAMTAGCFHLRSTDQIALNYTGTPVWTWYPA